MSARHKNVNDTLVNSHMLCKSVDEILTRIHLDRDHDIPYLAGYSVDRKKIYIDRHLEKSFVDHNGHKHDVDRFLILHEAADSHFTLPAKEDAPNLVDMQKPQFGSEEAYRAALAMYQITEADLADHLLSGLKALRFTDLRFRPEIQVTDPELLNERIMQALDMWLETARKQSRIEYREAAFK